MKSFLEFITEAKNAPDVVYHIHRVDDPSEKGKETHLAVAYHKSVNNSDGYIHKSVSSIAKEHPEGHSAHQAIGYAVLHKDKGNVYRAGKLEVDPDWQRKGVATSMYDHVRKSGLELKPSKDQSDKGKAFWKSYKKHIG